VRLAGIENKAQKPASCSLPLSPTPKREEPKVKENEVETRWRQEETPSGGSNAMNNHVDGG
jgi:hypothetical protein